MVAFLSRGRVRKFTLSKSPSLTVVPNGSWRPRTNLFVDCVLVSATSTRLLCGLSPLPSQVAIETA